MVPGKATRNYLAIGTALSAVAVGTAVPGLYSDPLGFKLLLLNIAAVVGFSGVGLIGIGAQRLARGV